jgi:hypothetical protein
MIADDFAAIKQNLERLEREKLAAIRGPVEEDPQYWWQSFHVAPDEDAA